MSKTITLRIDDEVYQILKTAANGEKRTISNFIEFAALNYLSSSTYVSDKEMEEIMNDTELKNSIHNALKDIEKGDYSIVS
ncbi:MAG: CopG family transcriptional regulator [Chlorobi bacterium]|nr:CopG family transcriptional regulator [Chlorobiota bacterium]